jgi:hypothetical protein
MTIEQKFRIATIAASAFALAAIGSFVAWISCNRANNRSRIDSPIVASGGSMTFRAQRGWTCSPSGSGMAGMNDFCWARDSISYFRVEDVQDDNGNQINDQQQPSGIVYFNLRQPDGTPSPKPQVPPTNPYIKLCTSGSNQANVGCNQQTGYILVQVYGPNSGLITSKAFEPNAAVKAVQYFDVTCHVHGTTSASTDTPPPYIPACEHPGWVGWLDNNSYKCKHGGCRVLLTTN